jgi:uncharacterized membrane protein (UPF0127 family)
MRAAVFTVLALLAFTARAAAFEQLPVQTIEIETNKGPHRFTVEVAADSASQERGLMYRRTLAPDAGMIFVFGQNEFVSFWMKNTFLPLDMLFVKADGTISTIQANAVPFSETSIQSAEPVLAVIELNGGRAKALGIEPGDKVRAQAFGNAIATN